MREVFFASEEPQKRASLQRAMVADGPTQHRITGLKRVEDGTRCDRSRHVESDFATDLSQYPKMIGEHDTNHVWFGPALVISMFSSVILLFETVITCLRQLSVCTSTDNTAGRSRTIGPQLSPASAEQYTWPPVVPK